MGPNQITQAQADRILKVLVELWADQHGLTVESVKIERSTSS